MHRELQRQVAIFDEVLIDENQHRLARVVGALQPTEGMFGSWWLQRVRVVFFNDLVRACVGQSRRPEVARGEYHVGPHGAMNQAVHDLGRQRGRVLEGLGSSKSCADK